MRITLSESAWGQTGGILTSSAVSNGTTQTTGPNISSVIRRDVSLTSVTTVGRIKYPWWNYIHSINITVSNTCNINIKSHKSFYSTKLTIIIYFNFKKEKNKKHCNVTKPGLQLINLTKGLNSAKKYAQGPLMTMLLWKFGQNPLRNVGVVMHRRNCLWTPFNLSENLVIFKNYFK